MAAALFAVPATPHAEPAEAPGFVGSQACGTCHSAELNAWSDSHHGWALREPEPANVLGDFADATLQSNGVTSRFFRDGDRYLVETDGADGKLATFEIRYVVGVTPLQQYLVELDGGRLQALDLAWDTEKKRWFNLYPDGEVAAGNGLHWTGPYKNWQARCAVCHQTDFDKGYDPATHAYQSTWSELTVGCEACHGPGEEHVAWAEKRPDFDATARDDTDALGLLRSFAEGRQEVEQNMCGPCHARREALEAHSTLPTAAFGDHHRLSVLRDGLYFPDGQQHEEVYILGSFLQSKMHEKGVTCSNCHDPHSAELVADGNAVCTQCHNEAGRTDFPTLKPALYNSPSHHHHQPGTDGAQCVNCHMPKRDYMLIDGRRDHFFRVPDPVLSAATGSPDACLSCHADQTATWAAEAIAAWAPERAAPASPHAEVFAKVWREGLSRRSVDALAGIALDATKPAIVRATAIREIGPADPATAETLAALLADESDLVRAAAIQLWRGAEPAVRVQRLQPMLADPIRAVRIAAGLELVNLPADSLPPEQQTALQQALDEVKASMLANADFPEGQMAIGGLAMATRQWDAAQAAFTEATFLDPQLVDAWLTRARIAAALGNAAEVDRHPGRGPRAEPRPTRGLRSELVGSLLAQGRPGEAIPILREILVSEPDNRDSRVTLAVLLLQSGDLAAAEREIGCPARSRARVVGSARAPCPLAGRDRRPRGGAGDRAPCDRVVPFPAVAA